MTSLYHFTMILPRAILFDFDGTLADSYEAITASVNHVRNRHDLAPLALAEVRRYVGHGIQQLLAQLVPGADPEESTRFYRAHHATVCESGTRLLPGVHGTVAELHQRGYRLGVCSNKLRRFTSRLLDHLGLLPLLDVVVGPEDVARLKPAPDMLLAALKTLKVPLGEALYIGDMSVDIDTARAAGVPVWVVATGSDTLEALRAAGPDRVLTEFRELAVLLPA